MYDFAYQKPGSLADAVKALSADADAKALAGGMTLIPVLKQRLAKPTTVVDLAKLGLSVITVSGNTVTIGAMTTHATVANSAEVKAKFPALAALASHIGDEAVRHRGTIGGSVANNDPSADYPAALLATGATVKTNKRSIKADDFFTGMFSTALEQGEVITSVEFPVPEKAAYEKFPNPASRYAMVGVFVAKTAGGVRVAVTGAGQGGVFRHADMEKALTAKFSPDAVAGISTPVADMNGDIHASPEYRAHLVGIMAKRAVAKAG
jgi:carbon-monoxide dehydrogenase medium subunit